MRPVRVFIDGDEFAFDSDGATRADAVYVGTLEVDADGRTVFVPPTAHTYEVRCDQLEVTRGPTINHPGDRERKFVSGPVHYLIDGEEVDEAAFNAATTAAGLSFNN